MEVEQVILPVPEPGEVRVRLEGSGVCGSNLPIWEGAPWFQYPCPAGAPGHEGWGVVDAVGPGVSTVSPGDRVAALSERAYAEYDLVSAAAVVPLPPNLAGTPFPGEPLGCAINAFRRCAIHPGQVVAIVGIGFLGALLTNLCSRAGARVIAASRRPFARRIAREMGAEMTVDLKDPSRVVAEVRARTRGEGADTVIEVVGLQEALDLATELTRVRGRLVIAGYHQNGPRKVNMQLWNWRGLDVINAHERERDVYLEGMRQAVQMVGNGTLDPSPLYTHTFPLDEVDEAFRSMSERPDGFLKALVIP